MSEDMNKTVRTALIVVSVAILIYFTLSAIRHGAPRVGGAAGQIQDTLK